MNFYQTEGMLSGRTEIEASDPRKTLILGNQRISYKTVGVNCDKFPWFARTFMKQHIEIENDPKVWGRVEAMIQQKWPATPRPTEAVMLTSTAWTGFCARCVSLRQP